MGDQDPSAWGILPCRKLYRNQSGLHWDWHWEVRGWSPSGVCSFSNKSEEAMVFLLGLTGVFQFLKDEDRLSLPFQILGRLRKELEWDRRPNPCAVTTCACGGNLLSCLCWICTRNEGLLIASKLTKVKRPEIGKFAVWFRKKKKAIASLFSFTFHSLRKSNFQGP